MGERKVLNKYIPPDFDPAKIPRGKAPKGGQIKVRIMLPMTICCNTCGNFITKGTKFNAKKEDVVGEDYLGMRIFRFYFRCTRCSAVLAMKTDPKNGDYVVEAGASRNYEMWKDTTEEDAERAKEEDEENNEMRRLENRAEESKREMDIMAALDEMRSLNARHAGVSSAAALSAMAARNADVSDEREAELDAETARAVFNQQRGQLIKRIDSESDSDDGPSKKAKMEPPPASIVIKRSTAAAKTKVKPTAAAKPEPSPAGLGGLLCDYGSESD
ncbi:CWC16 protein [Ostreococcus tauri]|uniref:Splicing factor YJU2 n=1 Tax=Ostreococcus tauri TaxID=70448 RepID=A0A090M544_OSTTA|nr:CWC16 protein [Ostreococcus tauri]CEF99355.1 CWC16 protein [Ostreococcus tauri]|eukprot:XP_022839788.1 CWC16 protein [Ostreococcus tauri]